MHVKVLFCCYFCLKFKINETYENAQVSSFVHFRWLYTFNKHTDIHVHVYLHSGFSPLKFQHFCSELSHKFVLYKVQHQQLTIWHSQVHIFRLHCTLKTKINLHDTKHMQSYEGHSNFNPLKINSVFIPILFIWVSQFPVLGLLGCIFYLNSTFIEDSAIRGDSDQPDATFFVVSDLGLSCLLMSHKKDTSIIRVKEG